MFFSTVRQAIRDRKRAEADRDYWRARAEAFERKLERRSDFFIDREMALVDRFLTSQTGSHAITDELKAKQRNPPELRQREIDEAREKFLAEKRQELIDYAIDAGVPAARAEYDFQENRDAYLVEFDQLMSGA